VPLRAAGDTTGDLLLAKLILGTFSRSLIVVGPGHLLG
jgi:hypothetical protein